MNAFMKGHDAVVKFIAARAGKLQKHYNVPSLLIGNKATGGSASMGSVP